MSKKKAPEPEPEATAEPEPVPVVANPKTMIAVDRWATGVYILIDAPETWFGSRPRVLTYDGVACERVGEHEGCAAYRVSR